MPSWTASPFTIDFFTRTLFPLIERPGRRDPDGALVIPLFLNFEFRGPFNEFFLGLLVEKDKRTRVGEIKWEQKKSVLM